MAHLQDLLNLSVEEAMDLTDRETQFLAQRVELELYRGTLTSGEVRSAIRERLEPALREVRALRAARSRGEDAGGGAIGAPNA